MAKTAIMKLSDFDPKNLPAVFGGYSEEDFTDLTNGVGSSFAVMSFRGKNWSIRYQGESTGIEDDEGEPLTKLSLVILRASRAITKTYYEGAYVEGADEKPTCVSYDGVAPDPNSPDVQNNICATCPKNQFGSGNNGKGKACQDNRRLAVLPAWDLRNEAYGGAMLLKLPPTSLANLAKLAEQLQELRLPLHAAVVKVSFDKTQTHPVLVFTLEGVVGTEEQAKVVIEQRDRSVVKEIIAGRQLTAPAAAAQTSPQPTREAAKAASRKKVDEEVAVEDENELSVDALLGNDDDEPAPKPAKAAKPKPAPVEEDDDDEPAPKPAKAAKPKPAPVEDEDDDEPPAKASKPAKTAPADLDDDLSALLADFD